MNIELNQEQAKVVQAVMAFGRYSSVGEAIAEALGLLHYKELMLERMRQDVVIGTQQIANGQVADGEAVFYDLQNRLAR